MTSDLPAQKVYVRWHTTSGILLIRNSILSIDMSESAMSGFSHNSYVLKCPCRSQSRTRELRFFY